MVRSVVIVRDLSYVPVTRNRVYFLSQQTNFLFATEPIAAITASSSKPSNVCNCSSSLSSPVAPCGTTQPPCSPTSKHITSVSNGPRSFVRIDTCFPPHTFSSEKAARRGIAGNHHVNCTPLFRRQTTTDCLREHSRHQPDQRDQHDKDISSRHIF